MHIICSQSLLTPYIGPCDFKNDIILAQQILVFRKEKIFIFHQVNFINKKNAPALPRAQNTKGFLIEFPSRKTDRNLLAELSAKKCDRSGK